MKRWFECLLCLLTALMILPLRLICVHASQSTVNVYRLYNQWSGEHLFTTDSDEYNKLPFYGWTQEGIAWKSPTTGNTPVYRLFNPYTGEHLFTTDANEYVTLPLYGWKQENIAFYSDDEQHSAVYRLYNPYTGLHHFTKDPVEYITLAIYGWTPEDVAWYSLDDLPNAEYNDYSTPSASDNQSSYFNTSSDDNSYQKEKENTGYNVNGRHFNFSDYDSVNDAGVAAYQYRNYLREKGIKADVTHDWN